MPRIRLLSDQLINKIAAGEVVERPASVVKELAENAVDAGARSVRVRLSEGGVTAVTVIDDGVGMSRQDAQLSLSRHATSKLTDADGLFQIVTKGFRGEALPSIASVSRFSLVTAEAGAEVGTGLTAEGGAEALVADAPPVVGTRIDVEDLFFNVPARRKFLKRESTELAHCQEAVIRLALAHPEVGFFLEHGGRQLLASPATGGDLKERVVAALGAEVGPHLLEVEERRLGVVVTGVVASPEYTMATARGLYTFVNRRYIRDRGLTAAVQRSFQDSLPPGRQPVAVIFIDLDPRDVDVNVHPQKLEVRFSDPRSVQDAVVAAVSRALKAAPWRNNPSQPVEGDAAEHYARAVERFLTRMEGPGGIQGGALLDAPAGQHPGFGTQRPTLNQAPPEGYFSQLSCLGDLGRRYWVCTAPGGTLVVLDPHAARERVIVDALARRRAGKSAAPLLTLGQTVDLPPAARAALLAQAPVLAALGLELEAFGGETIVLRTAPPEIDTSALEGLVQALAECAANRPEPEGLAAVLACQGAGAAERAPSQDEARRLFEALDRADFALPVRHPSVVLHEVTLLRLDELAGRG